MMMVLEAGMSSPDSTMAVDTSTSACPSTNLTMTDSSSRSPIWPWPMSTRASGQSSWMKAVMAGGDRTRLWTEENGPPRGAARGVAPPRMGRRERVRDDGRGEAGHHRLDGKSVDGRRLDDGEIAHAGQRHVERAGDGRGGEGEGVHAGAELLDPLLVGDAEAMLLVDHEEAQGAKAHVLGEEAMGADDHVHPSRTQALPHPL